MRIYAIYIICALKTANDYHSMNNARSRRGQVGILVLGALRYMKKHC